MLANNALTIATSATKPLIDQGRSLLAQPNTMLSELINLLMTGANLLQIPPEADRGAILSTFVTNTNNPLFDAAQDQLELDLANIVKGHLNFARNVVKPVVSEMVEQSVASAAAYKPKDVISDFDLIKLSYPAPLTDDGFAAEIMKAEQAKFTPPAKLLNLGAFDREKAINGLSTGYADVDDLIRKWIVTLPIEFFERIWNDFFGSNHIVPNYQQGGHPYEMLSVYLTIVLWSRHFAADVQETGVSLADYKYSLSQQESWAEMNLAKSMRAANANDFRKQVVLNARVGNQAVIVSERAFNEMIAAGGSPEWVLAQAVSSISAPTISLMQEKSVELQKAWTDYVMFVRSGDSRRYSDTIRSVLKGHFHQLLVRGLTPEEENYIQDNQRAKDAFILDAVKRADEYIDRLSDAELRQIPTVCQYLIAKIRFSYSSAYQILTEIENVYRDNPGVDIDVREAALVAASAYLSDFFASQITVK